MFKILNIFKKSNKIYPSKVKLTNKQKNKIFYIFLHDFILFKNIKQITKISLNDIYKLSIEFLIIEDDNIKKILKINNIEDNLDNIIGYINELSYNYLKGKY